MGLSSAVDEAESLLDEYLAFALAVCRESGEILVSTRARGGMKVDRKAGFELVTSVDLAVHQHFEARIGKAWPDFLLVSEEGARSADVGHRPHWIVDPIDGTANFVHGQDHVAISAALSIDGQVVLGVVHAPFQKQTFWAIRGRGAYRDGERIEVDPNPDPARALIATGFPHERGEIDLLLDRLKPVLRHFGDIRRLAAPALDICWVADGRLTAFFDRIHLWDVAAAGLIASEAGAQVGTVGNADTQSSAKDYLVAPPSHFGKLQRLLEPGTGAE